MARSSHLAALALGMALAAAPAAAQTPKLIGSFQEWDAFSYTDQGARVCYIAASPADSEPKNVRRGDVYFMVTHRKADKVAGEVSVFTGYTYKESSAVAVTVGAERYELFTQGESAWLRDAAAEKKLVEAMIRGTTLVVRGVSSRNTKTTDRYSLLGFTAAYKAIGRACGGS